jgi:hypothetical protein
MSKEEGMVRYIELLDKHCPEWKSVGSLPGGGGGGGSKQGGGGPMGPVISTLMNFDLSLGEDGEAEAGARAAGTEGGGAAARVREGEGAHGLAAKGDAEGLAALLDQGEWLSHFFSDLDRGRTGSYSASFHAALDPIQLASFLL